MVCVNKGNIAIFTIELPDTDPFTPGKQSDVDKTGLYAGTTWRLNWGDGTINNYPSVSDNDIPTDISFLSHKYLTASNCVYRVTLTVTNPCGEIGLVTWPIDVHGRDQGDNNGQLIIEDVATHVTDVIEVCEGVNHSIFLRDISNWNCQNPTFPDGTPASPNDEPRTIQWVYGEDDGGGVQNTIGTILGTLAPVMIGGSHPATTINGYEQIPVIGPITSTGQLSQEIVIPADCRAGEYFDVYLRNWNKCNPYPSDDPVFTHIRILVVDAPPAPTIDDPTICFGGSTLLDPISTPEGVFHWYDHNMDFITIADTYDPGVTAPGTYTYYVTDQQLAGDYCESPATEITLIINPVPNKPTISRNNPDFCYDGSGSITLTADPHSLPAVTGYRWFRNGNPVAGETSSTIVLSTVAQSGSYTVMTLGVAPTFCESPLSDPVAVVIGEPADVDAGPPTATICSNSSYSTNGSFSGSASSASWSSSGDGTFADINDLTTTYTPGANDIINGSVTITLTTNDPANPCPAVNDNLILTVVRAPSANAGADAAICQTGTYHITDASVSNQASFSWSIINGAGSLNNTGIIGPTYTPGPGDAGNTVRLRLTATGNAPCAAATDDILIYVDRTPVATANLSQAICGNLAAIATLQGNMGGMDLNSGATGLWSFPSVWKEAFTGLADGTTSDAGPTAWTRTRSNTVTSWYSEVRNQRYEMRGNQTVWTSGPINISSYSSAGVSVDLSSMTTGGFETADYIIVRCIVNGTPQAPFWSSTGAVDGTTGGPSYAFRTRTAFSPAVAGTTLQVQIEARTSSTDEYYYFDNITVTEGSTPVITNPANPTSTVTNLPSGPTTFTWTVSSAHGGCTQATATHTITRWDPPTAANAGTDGNVCENVTTFTLAGNTPVIGTGQWSTAGTAVITNPASPSSGVTNLAYGNSTFTWTISNGTCTSSTDVVTIFRNSPVSPGNISADQNICAGETPASLTGTIASGGDGINYTYSWQYSTGSSGGPWTTIASTNSTGYTPGPLSSTTWYRRRVSSGSAGCLTQQNVPSTNVVEIFVEPKLLPGSISGSQSICLNEFPAAFTSVEAATGGNSPSYLWYHKLDAGAWAPLTGETNPTYTAPNTLVVGTHFYYREAISSTGYCDPVKTNEVNIIVNPGKTDQINAISGDPSKCEDQTITLNYPAVTNATEYAWDFSWVAGEVNATTSVPQIVINLSSYTFSSPFQDVTITVAGVNGCNNDPAPLTGDYPWSTPHNLRIYQNPETNAGTDNSVCGSLNITLAATASVGTGTWTDLGTGPGTVSFSNPNLPGAVATATRYGTYNLRWSENNGGCTDFDNVSVTFYEQPAVAAPADLNLCGTLTTTLNATGHTYQAGSAFSPVFLWEYVSGPDNSPSFGTANAAGTTVAVDYYGVYRFRITESNGTCSHSDLVDVTFSEKPVNASAGTDFNAACDLMSVNLNGTAHSYLGGSNVNAGTRTWSYVSGPDNTPSFSDPTDPDTQVAVDEYGDYEFRWTETNGSCSVTDIVTVKFFENPDNITGSGPYQAVCDAKNTDISVTAYSYTGAAATHPGSTRTWSYRSGPDPTPAFSAPTNPNTNVAVDNYGTYVFRWTETNGPCSNYVDVTVIFYENPDGASAGPNLTSVCNSKSVNLAGTAHNYEAPPSTHTGSTRGWSYISGPDNTPSFTSPASPTSEVVVDYFGTYEFEWTETNGNCETKDRVIVRFSEDPVDALAGNDIVAACNSYIATLNGTAHSYDALPNLHAGSTRTWSYVNGPDASPAFADATDPKTTVQVDYYGTYTFRWTEINGNCTRSDDVKVTFHENPADASAGPAVTGTCGNRTAALEGTAHSYDADPNDHTGSNRTWAYVTGPDNTPLFDDPTDPETDVTVDQYGVYTFRWTEINGNCTVSTTTTVTFYEAPTVTVTPVADVCRDHSLAVIPISGTFSGGAASATWSIVSGGGTIQNIVTTGNIVTAEYKPVYDDVDAGSVTLRLTSDDPAGPCTTAHTDLTINIDEAVYVVIDQAPSVVIAEGTSAIITATISGARGTVTTGVWTETGTLTGGTFTPDNLTNNITFTPTAAQVASGSVVLRLTSSDPGTSCGPAYAEVIVYIGANPVADAGKDIEICAPADLLIHLRGYAKISASDANWTVVSGVGTILSQTKTWSVPQSVPHDKYDSLLVEAVYKIAQTEYGAPNTSSSFRFRLTTDDPDGAGPVSDDWDEMVYTVHWPPQTPTIGGGGKANMCVNSQGNFYSVPLIPGNTYQWEIEVLTGSGVPGTDYIVRAGGTGYNYIVIDWITIGTYNLNVTETSYLSDNITPCPGITVVKPIGVFAPPVVSGGPGAVICLGDTYNLAGSVTGGSGSFLYEWSPSVGLSSFNIPDPVVTGTFIGDVVYTLKVTDLLSGCISASGTVTITTNPLPNIYSLTGPAYYCSGALTGVTLTLSDSETGVLYQLMNGATPIGAPVSGTGDAIAWNNLFDGSYFVEAFRNAVPACRRTMAGVVNIIANPAITMSVNQVVNVKCFGGNDGSISITPSGGTAPYTFLWSGPGSFSSTNEDISGLMAGNYNVITTDSRGCQHVSGNINVSQPALLALSDIRETKPVTCYGGSDGEAEVTIDISTGTAPYTFQWFYNAALSSPVSGAISSVLSGVPAGTYYVLVMDANLCTVTRSVTITQPPQITGSGAVTTPVSCNGVSDAVITVTAAGGSGLLQYDLNNAGLWQDSNIFPGLGAGNFTLRLRDTNAPSCIVNLPDVVIAQPPVLAVSITSQTNILCFGNSTGSAVATPSGGTPPYNYSWNTVPVQTTASATSLAEGNYTVTVTDNRGCTATANVSITLPAGAMSVSFTKVDVLCAGNSTGSATAIPAGGTLPYFYNWYSNAALTAPIGQVTSTAVNLPSGTYYVKVTDSNGCEITGNVTITEPGPLGASITSQSNAVCFGGATGSVTVGVTAGSGTSPYQYSINGGSAWQNNGTFNTLAAANYTVVVRDANSCFIQVPVTITQPPQLTATITGITSVSCNGGSNGSVTVTATAGSGVSPYEYSINGIPGWKSDGTFTGLSAGSYNVTVRDANSCTVVIPVVITEPGPLLLTKTPDVLLDCHDDKDGTGTFYVAGGTMNYTFTESLTGEATFAAPGFNSYSFYNAGAGVVSVRVTDAKGCFEVASITITQPSPLTPGTIRPDLQILCTGSNPAELTSFLPAVGGPGPVTYQWQYSNDIGGPFFNLTGTGANYLSPVPATYTLFYRRAAFSGICPPVYSNIVEVRINPMPVAIISGDATICPGDEATLEVRLPAGTGPFEIDIIDDKGIVTSFTSNNDIIVSPSETTKYKLHRVKDSNGCEVTGAPNLIGEATIIVRDRPTVTNPEDKVVCEYGITDFTVTGGGTGVSYQWYVNKNDGTGITALEDEGVYFGAHDETLNLYGVTRDMDGYTYHVVASGCGLSAVSEDALLTVNTVPEIFRQPRDTVVCSTGEAVFHISAKGTSLTFRWQVRKRTGSFVDVATDLTNFSGASDSILILSNVPEDYNNYLFQVIVGGDCGVPLRSNVVALRVNRPPTVSIQPGDKAICDGAGSVWFRSGGSGMIDSLRWQVFLPLATDWTDIYDDDIYNGTTTQQLSLVNPPIAYSGNQYRLALKAFCGMVPSNPATLTVNSNPVVTFTTNPIPACGGKEVVITPKIDDGSQPWKRHTWTGDIIALNNYFVQNPTFKTMMPGRYELNYRVEDNNGCFGNGDVTVEVDSPDASFIVDPVISCTPGTVQFTKDDWTGIASWTWDFNDGTTNSTDKNPSHTFINTNPTAIQYYRVKLTVVSPGNCEVSATQLVTVFPAVDATFTANKLVVCSGDIVKFSARPGAGYYTWDYGDGAYGSGTDLSEHPYINNTTDPVVYRVTLITTSLYDCSDIKTLDITVMPVPIPQFTAAPLTQVFNASGNPVTFTNTTNEGTWTFKWRYGDGSTSTEGEEVHSYTYNGVGTYPVTLIAGNSFCSDSVKHNISVVPPAPVANFDLPASGCAPLYVNINNTSLNTEVPGTTYRWDFGDGSTSTAKNPTYTYFTPGDFTIRLFITGPGGQSEKSQVVHAYPSPKAYFEITPDMVYANDERVRCFNLSQGAASYLWDFGDGDTSKVREPYHRYMEEGIYDITLWAYSENGCTDKYVLSPAVTVEPVGELRFATVFQPNKTGPIERTDLPTGGTEVDQFFYPPIRQKVENYKLQIFNRLGVLIFESHDINIPWNGYYKGNLCQQGVYVWYVEGKYADGKPFKMVGNVTLLRWDQINLTSTVVASPAQRGKATLYPNHNCTDCPPSLRVPPSGTKQPFPHAVFLNLTLLPKKIHFFRKKLRLYFFLAPRLFNIAIAIQF